MFAASRNIQCTQPKIIVYRSVLNNSLNLLRSFAVSSTTMATSDKWKSVLEYWFGIPNRKFEENSPKWFNGGEAVNNEIREKFGSLVKEASDGGFKDWEDDVSSTLALIILLDQFTRNIYKGKPAAFASDERAFSLAQKIAEGPWAESHKSVLSVQERVFAYIPYMHHESNEAQAQCVHLYTSFMKEQKGTEHEGRIKNNQQYAIDHQMIIKKFGRFPFRNVVLGRENTPEEEAFFKETGDKYKW